MSNPTRGYSWAPFTAGHELSLKHGADSERRWRPVAERLAADLLAERPWLADHRRTVDAWARVEAQARLIGDWLDTHGLLDDEGEPRPASNRLDRLEARAQSLRADLAEPPLAMARLLGTLTDTAVTAGRVDAVTDLAAQGARFVERWRNQREALPAAPGAAEGTEKGDPA
jgi:hypothetical protein